MWRRVAVSTVRMDLEALLEEGKRPGGVPSLSLGTPSSPMSGDDDDEAKGSKGRKQKGMLGPCLVVFYWVSVVTIECTASFIFFQCA